MKRYEATFTVWGNPMDVTVYAGSEAEALESLDRRYGYLDEGSLSVTEEKKDGRRKPVVVGTERLFCQGASS